MISSDDVLTLWFGDRSRELDDEARKRWWKKDAEFDAMLRERFGDALAAARKGELDDWAETPEGALGLVILLDQFGRNCDRGTAAMYDGDARALAIAERSIARGDMEKLRPVERTFLYMPLMHAEDRGAQDRCVALFEAAVKEGWGDAGYLGYAHAHRDIVARFGRFPHRNAILGRKSTPEEEAFLKEPGSAF